MPFTVKKEPPKFDLYANKQGEFDGVARHSVHSSHGHIVIDRQGFVISRAISKCCPITSPPGSPNHFELLTAFAFDVCEWEEYWKKEYGKAGDLDILDIGFWYVDEQGRVQYSAPEMNWREDVVKLRRGEEL